ncbi:hypothetical protein [Clostridium celatum]|uniref:Uncharacterized protein n=1 Tax=Clostridium celatum DSM 1785 TaxID=545697 RepID=L1QJN7_9CLOT|nr:hypothetical protein [Clostridium celatum]EKY28156.1 hypothetical protein HMPREF0216_00999 [Clostridium celatum DSM 1785]MCE9654086.1 hypothetical protein [Clostridium celatum]MDU6296508.1 hypothetical protein [Clostridium celatum]MDY3361411.1 hypothetical protein [Clostridium celatum]
MLVIVVLKLSNSIIVFLIFDELFMALDNDEFLINIKTFKDITRAILMVII